jgi:hypothetical protein
VSGPRTVADMYGTGIPTEHAPRVERTILDGGEDYTVDVDLTPAAAVMLEALAAAMQNDEAIASEWYFLRFATGTERRALAVRELLASEAVRRALTLRLTPETADHLHNQLDEASVEPARCEHGASLMWSVEDGCSRYVEDGEHICPQHSDPDDTTDRYGL